MKDVLNERERDEVEGCRRYVRGPVGNSATSRICWLLGIVDRLAPKPAPKETVEDVLREMRRDTNFVGHATAKLWADRIEAALKQEKDNA